MLGTILVQVVVALVVIIAIVAYSVRVLWWLKSAEDRKAFKNVLDEKRVITTGSPEEYVAARNRRDRRRNGSSS